jgi:hypothetical protein
LSLKYMHHRYFERKYFQFPPPPSLPLPYSSFLSMLIWYGYLYSFILPFTLENILKHLPFILFLTLVFFLNNTYFLKVQIYLIQSNCLESPTAQIKVEAAK